jgi:hypothetical protein
MDPVSPDRPSEHERFLIEQGRKVNKLLSLYVLAIQDKRSLAANEHAGLARVLRSGADVIVQEGQRAPSQPSSSAHPMIGDNIGGGPPSDGTIGKM